MSHIDATAACVLGLLLLGPAPGLAPAAPDGAMTGWQLYETAARSLGRFWNVTRSQIYLELGRLADAGLVEARAATGPRSRRPYWITNAGRRAFSTWLADFARAEPRDDLLRSPLLLTVFFGDYLPREVLTRVLQEYRPRWQRQLDQTSQMLAAVDDEARHRPPTAVLRRGVAYRELMVAWIDSVLEEVRQNDAQQGEAPA
jgi:DNA-binding PadR family transcriptional regulator